MILTQISFNGKIPLYIRFVEWARCFITGKCEHRIYTFAGPHLKTVSEECQFCGKDFPLPKTEDVKKKLAETGLNLGEGK